jgi:uncharacterized protein YcbX
VKDPVVVSALHSYPVKSCRGLSHERKVVQATGFEGDRDWMFVTDEGRFVTQRECGGLARVEVALEKSDVVLRAAGHPELRCPIEEPAPAIRVRIWRDECIAHPSRVNTRDWLEAAAGIRAQLVRAAPGHDRVSDAHFTGRDEGRLHFADAYAFMLASESSLADLNSRLPRPLPMARFRPNVVLRGLEPYAEDDIDRIVFGEIELKCVKPCIRCITTTTDQLTGERDGEEPLRTLRSYRRLASLKGVAFGVNAILIRGAGKSLAVGDRAEIVWRVAGAPRPW